MSNVFEYDQYLQLRTLAWEFYCQYQPRKEIPVWIVLNSTTMAEKTKSGIGIVTGYLFKRHDLPPGITWERRKDGSNELVSRDLETGERMLLASYDVEDSKMLDLFKAEVDLSSRMVTMKYAVAANQLQPEDFMLEYDNFDLTKMWRFDLSTEQNRLNILGHK